MAWRAGSESEITGRSARSGVASPVNFVRDETPAQRRLGIVLAGGAGSRLGGAKALAVLGGRSLAAWVVDALAAVSEEVVIVGKRASAVPVLPGVGVWREPAEPVHPLAGVVWALSRAGGADLLVAAVDLPFCAEAVRELVRAAGADGRRAPVLVAHGQPLLGVYRSPAAPELRAAVEAGRPARATIAGLGAVTVQVPAPERTLFNVNTPEDLARAEAMLRGAAPADA